MSFYHLAVYNRWGQKVFETSDQAIGWNGTFKQRELDAANYVWICEYVPVTAPQKKVLKGNVMLIR
jgi:gliding motility-associated-like protein